MFEQHEPLSGTLSARTSLPESTIGSRIREGVRSSSWATSQLPPNPLPNARILAIGDYEALLISRTTILRQAGYPVHSCESMRALECMIAEPFDVALVCSSV